MPHHPLFHNSKSANIIRACFRRYFFSILLLSGCLTLVVAAPARTTSLSSSEAVHVTSAVANDANAPFSQVTQRTIQAQNQVLNSSELTTPVAATDWHAKLVSTLTNPKVVYILLILGIWGLFFEFANPGFILPGTVGVICLLLSFYAFHLLLVNYVGLGLILLGIAFLIAEAFLPTFGAFAIGGLVAFFIGSFMLFDESSVNQPGRTLIFAVGIVTAAFFLMVINLALKARFRPVVSGREELVGSTAAVVIEEKNYPRIHLRGEWWQVRCETSLLTQRQHVRVIGIEGLILIVSPLDTPAQSTETNNKSDNKKIP